MARLLPYLVAEPQGPKPQAQGLPVDSDRVAFLQYLREMRKVEVEVFLPCQIYYLFLKLIRERLRGRTAPIAVTVSIRPFPLYLTLVLLNCRTEIPRAAAASLPVIFPRIAPSTTLNLLTSSIMNVTPFFIGAPPFLMLLLSSGGDKFILQRRGVIIILQGQHVKIH